MDHNPGVVVKMELKTGLIIFGIIVMVLGLYVFSGCFNKQNDFQMQWGSLIGGVSVFVVGAFITGACIYYGGSRHTKEMGKGGGGY